MIMCYNEETLIAMLRDPNTKSKAFGDLIQIYSERLYWKIRRLVLSHDDADDVLQNTFLKAWRSIDSFRYNSKLSTWLFSIAINESLDFIRKQKRQADGNSEDMSIADTLMADEYFDGSQAEALLQEAIASLPTVQRTVFTMKYFEGMKYSEISEILKTSDGALKASYHIAVKKITEYLEGKEA